MWTNLLDPFCNRSLHICVRTLAFAKGGRFMRRVLPRCQLPHNFDAWNTSSDHNQSFMHIIKHHVFKIRDVQQGRLASPRDTPGSNLRQRHATSRKHRQFLFLYPGSPNRASVLDVFSLKSCNVSKRLEPSVPMGSTPAALSGHQCAVRVSLPRHRSTPKDLCQQ